MSYRVINGKLYPVGTFPEATRGQVQNNSKVNNNDSFNSILKKEINKDNNFTISKHAAERLRERQIYFDENDMKNINSCINKAKERGSKDSLILYKDVALVTSIKNRTIITAVDKNESRDKIFTNIDSVVLL